MHLLEGASRNTPIREYESPLRVQNILRLLGEFDMSIRKLFLLAIVQSQDRFPITSL